MTSKAYKIGWWLLMVFNLVGLWNSLLILLQIVLVYITLAVLTSPLAEFWINNSGLIIFPFLISLVVFLSFYFSIKARFAERKFLILSIVTSVLSMVSINVFNISFINSGGSLPIQLNVFGYVLVVIFVVSIVLLLLGLKSTTSEVATLGKKSKWFLTIFGIFPLIVAIASTIFCFYDLLTNDYGYGTVAYKVGKPVLVYDLTKRTQGQMISSLKVNYESAPITVYQTVTDRNGGNNIIFSQTLEPGADVDQDINKILKKYQYSEIYLTKLGKKAYLTVPTTENKNEIILLNNNGVQVMIVSQNPLDEVGANMLMDKLIEK